MLQYIILGLLFILALGGLIVAFGPREPIDEEVSFQPPDLGEDLDSYLAEREARIGDIRPGTEKEIVWRSSWRKHKTKISVVYIHGYSASKEEIRPLPDLVSDALKANVFYTRLSGHGRTSEAMGEPRVNDWFNDISEALAIGRAIGDKVIIISTSTGGTLSTWAATKPELMKDVLGIIMISPNFGVNDTAAQVLTLGGARTWLPWLVGKWRDATPVNEGHAKWWTVKYPILAALPMAAVVKFVNTLEIEDISTPALFVFHEEDAVVRPEATRVVAQEWAMRTEAAVTIFRVTQSGDTGNHVIAGRIFSPDNTKPLADKITAWIKAL